MYKCIIVIIHRVEEGREGDEKQRVREKAKMSQTGKKDRPHKLCLSE